MSRCFPFPPPGYENKARTVDVDILKKEKHREKKHKKEKKDTEKRERKDKRDIDRSDEKHREKDKKEKKRDKKDKEKERDNARERLSTSDERSLLGKTESRNGEIFFQTAYKNKGHIGSDEKKYAGYIGNRSSQNTYPSEETINSKLEKFTVTQPNRADGMANLVAKGSNTFSEGNEKNKNTKINDRKIEGQRIEARYSGHAAVRNSSRGSPAKLELIVKPSENNSDKWIGTKENIKEKGIHKDKDKEQKGKEKVGERKKEKRKEERPKEKVDRSSVELDKLKDSQMNNLIDTHSIKSSQLPKDSDKSPAADGNIKKRKEYEINEVLHENDNRSSKLQRPTTSFHPYKGNGTIAEPHQTSVLSASNRHGVANNIKLDNKERSKNGIIEAHPSASTGQADKIVALPTRSCHQDSKCLSVVYSVPKMEEWSDFGDDEWLLSSSDTKLNKTELKSSEVEETPPQVWAEATRIESADIYALPYVIPY